MAIINGTALSDVPLNGTVNPDIIYANDGNDLVFGDGFVPVPGPGGADLIYGGAGIDTIYGENGTDLIYGGIDGDFLYGEADNDVLYGEDGNDNVIGGDGNDVVSGGVGIDTIYGGFGADIFSFSEYFAGEVKDFTPSEGDILLFF